MRGRPFGHRGGMSHNTTLGRAGEQRAADYLQGRGFDVVDRNWRCSAGEIDLVATHGDVLAIVEVKTRSNKRYGHPLEALDRAKVDRLWRLALMWARTHPETARGRRIRVDAVAVIGADPDTASVEHLAGLS